MARKPTRGPIKQPFSAATNSKPSKSQSKSTTEPNLKRKSKPDPSEIYTYLPTLPKRHRTSEAQLSLTHAEEALAKPRRDPHPKKGKGKGRQDGDEEDGENGEEDDMEERIRKVAMMIAGDDVGAVESEDSDVESDEAWESGGSDDERWGDVFRDLEKGKGKGKKAAKEVIRKPAKPLTVNLDESEDEIPQKGKSAATAKVSDEAASETEGEGDDDTSEEADDSLEDIEDTEDEIKEDEHLEDDSDQESDEDSVKASYMMQIRRFGPPESHNSEDEEEEEPEKSSTVEDNNSESDLGDDDGEDAEESDVELPSDLSEDEEGPNTLDGLDAFVNQLAAGDKKRKADTSVEGTGDAGKKRRVLPVIAGPALGGASELGLRSNQKIDLSAMIASHPSLKSASSLLPPKTSKAPTSILKSGTLPAPLPTITQDRLSREAAYGQTKSEGAKWAGVMKRIKESQHLSFPLQNSDRGGTKSSGEILSNFKPQSGLESAVTRLLESAGLTEDGVTKKENELLEGQELSLEEVERRRAELRTQRELMFRAEARSKRVAKIKSKTFRKLARKRAERAGGVEELDEEMGEEDREKMERDRAVERATLRHGAKSGRWARDVGGDAGELEDRRKAKEEMLDIRDRLQRKIHGRGEGEGDESEDDESEGSASEDGDEEGLKKRAFEQLERLEAGEGDDQGEKGLMGMAFMKKAREREMRKVREDEQDLRKKIEMFGADSEEDGEPVNERHAESMRVGGNEGRMVFSGPTPSNDIALPTALPVNDSTADTFRGSEPLRDASPAASGANPWLIQTSTSGPSRKRNTAINASSSAADKSTKALKKAAGRNQPDQGDESIAIETDGTALLRRQRNGGAEDGDDDGEDELMPVGKVRGFGQRDLVAEAFAGDDVVQDFEAEKQRQVDADAPTIEDTTLPGWGSWGGRGTKKRKTNPQNLIQKPGIDPSTRKDFGRANVIISEKKEKKASALLPKDLPYPYTSRAQYEASLANPVGGEWNSRAGVQRGTLPRVIKKPGAIIEPVRRLF